MNNNDISNLINMIGNFDKNKLSEGLNKINRILTPEEKQKLMQILNSKNDS